MVLAALVIGIILIVVGGIVNRIKYEGGYVYQVVGGFLLGSAVIGLMIFTCHIIIFLLNIKVNFMMVVPQVKYKLSHN